jgi:hypothetical protein
MHLPLINLTCCSEILQIWLAETSHCPNADEYSQHTSNSVLCEYQVSHFKFLLLSIHGLRGHCQPCHVVVPDPYSSWVHPSLTQPWILQMGAPHHHHHHHHHLVCSQPPVHSQQAAAANHLPQIQITEAMWSKYINLCIWVRWPQCRLKFDIPSKACVKVMSV